MEGYGVLTKSFCGTIGVCPYAALEAMVVSCIL